MKRVCLHCGKEFDAAPGTTLCRECAAASKASTHWRDRECRQCGRHFLGGPRAWYCPECRRERKKAAYRRYHRDGPARPLGSTDLCQRCGQPYTVESGTQMYCPTCGPIVLREIDRAQSRAWNAAHVDKDQLIADRRASAGQIRCAICGKLFTPHDPSLTCSPECSAELHKRRTAAWEKSHRAERTAAEKSTRNQRLAAMTPEELAAYREHTNALNRASYHARKNQKTTAPSEGQEGDQNDT